MRTSSASDIRYVDVAVSAAQILNVGATPIPVLDSPGPGKLVIPLATYSHFHCGSSQYSTNLAEDGQLILAYSDLSATFPSGIDVNGDVDADVYRVVTAISTLFPNLGLALSNSSGASPTDGNGTVRARVYFRVIRYPI